MNGTLTVAVEGRGAFFNLLLTSKFLLSEIKTGDLPEINTRVKTDENKMKRILKEANTLVGHTACKIIKVSVR